MKNIILIFLLLTIQTFGQFEQFDFFKGMSKVQNTVPPPHNYMLDSLVAYWKGGSLVDTTGHGNTLTKNGSPTVVSGVGTGNAWDCVGGNYVKRTSNYNLQMGHSDYTIAFWVKRGSLDEDNGNFSNIIGSTSINQLPAINYEYIPFTLTNSDPVISRLYLSQTVGDTIHYVWDEGWHLFVITRTLVDSSTIVYDNGIRIDSLKTSIGTYTNGNFFLGYGSDALELFIGDVGIWHRNISSTEVLTLWNTGLGNTYPLGSLNYYEHPNSTIKSVGIDVSKTPNEAFLTVSSTQNFSAGDSLYIWNVKFNAIDTLALFTRNFWHITDIKNDTTLNVDFYPIIDDGEDLYISNDYPFCIDLSRTVLTAYSGSPATNGITPIRVVRPHGTVFAGTTLIIGGHDFGFLLQEFPNPMDLRYHWDIISPIANDVIPDTLLACVYVASKDRVYFVSHSGILELNPHNQQIQLVISLQGKIGGGSIATDGSYLYVVTFNENPSVIYKYALSNFTLTDSVHIAGKTYGHAIGYDGAYLYATSALPTGTNWLAKVNPSDLTYSIIDVGGKPTDDMCFTSDYVYLGYEDTTECERFLKSDLSSGGMVNVGNRVYAMFSDNNYVYVGSSQNNNMERISNPNSSTFGDLTVQTYTVSGVSGSVNEILALGDNLYFTSYYPSKIGVISKNVFN
jgi:hypothetical protein